MSATTSTRPSGLQRLTVLSAAVATLGLRRSTIARAEAAYDDEPQPETMPKQRGPDALYRRGRIAKHAERVARYDRAPGTMAAAQAKRDRKAAKRRADAWKQFVGIANARIALHRASGASTGWYW